MSIEKLCRTLRKLSGKLIRHKISQLTNDEICKALIEQRRQQQQQQQLGQQTGNNKDNKLKL